MEYAVGITLALAVSAFATLVGFDRDRAFYPIVTIVVASYYDLFAVMGQSTRALTLEIIATAAFVLASVVGFRRNLWVVAVALAGHGVFDYFHAGLIPNAGVPVWWPMFCLSYDVLAGAYLALLLARSKITARARGLSA
jgi:hypothetical protein